MNQARQLRDLAVPPGNRLEALKGDREGFHSIRVNDQWRIVFRWTEEGPAEVAIVDYWHGIQTECDFRALGRRAEELRGKVRPAVSLAS